MDRKEDRKVGGYLFLSEEDAKLADQEKKKIEYLEKCMDYSSSQNVLEVYKKANAGRVFVTPVGYSYLKKMQEYLVQCEEIDSEQIPALELYQTYEPTMRKSYAPARQYVRPSHQKKAQWPVFSIIANIILVLAVAGMFWIAIESENPNIINYKTVLTNQYASWEQELSQREEAVRQKEKDLEIIVD